MATYSLPQPSRNFMSDNRGFTDPLNYSSQRQSPQTKSPASENARDASREVLPGVNELLSSPPSRIGTHPLSFESQPPIHAPSSSFGPDGIHVTDKPSYGVSDRAFKSSSQELRAHSLHQFPQSYQPRIETNQNRPTLPPSSFASVSPRDPSYHHSFQRISPQAPHFPPPPQSQISPTEYSSSPYPRDDSRSDTPQQPYSKRSPSRPALTFSRSSSHRDSQLSRVSSPQQQNPTTSNPVKLQPRMIREDVVPGEGAVWVYEDGTTCPKLIDGEPVNAQWGITKAGKPRKRLAIACTTCREKKIKCEPAMPKCAQCEKFGRNCRYTTAPRNQRTSPEPTSYNFQARSKHASSQSENSKRSLLPSAIDTSVDHNMVIDWQHSPRDIHQEKSSSAAAVQGGARSPPQKKRRPEFSPSFGFDVKPNRKFLDRNKSASPAYHDLQLQDEEGKLEASSTRYDLAWDPRSIDARAVDHYVDTYLRCVDGKTFRVFPRVAFFRWIEEQDYLSLDDRMVLYAVLALGALFSPRDGARTNGEIFVQIARRGLGKNQTCYSIQTIHTQILVAIYQFAKGDFWLAWDFIGSALRAVTALKYNIEDRCVDTQQGDMKQYGLGRHGLAECRRRTFWLAFALDRLSGFCEEHLSIIQSEDSLLRLPCQESQYAEQLSSSAPFYDNGLIDPALCKVDDSSAIGPTAYLVQILSIWGDVIAYGSRHARQEVRRYASDYEDFYSKTLERLYHWVKSLPSGLEATISDLFTPKESDTNDLFLTIHTIYHAINIKLNRNFYHRRVTSWSTTRNISKARQHAEDFLSMVKVISDKTHLRSSANIYGEEHPHLPVSTPFIAYTTMLAVDVLTAGGPLNTHSLNDLYQSISYCLTAVSGGTSIWASARGQYNATLKRIDALRLAANSDAANDKKAWRFLKPLDPVSQPDQDVFYPASFQQGKKAEEGAGSSEANILFKHMEMPIKSEDVLIIE